jgi:DNA-binding SARP family transcriptional activator/tetratricopeptide (TPR) repeat protein
VCGKLKINRRKLPLTRLSSSIEASTPRLRIRILGSFIVERDGREIPSQAWKRKRALDLLQLLAIAPRHRLTRDRLIEELWPEKDAQSGANNLHRALHDLRKVIGHELVEIERGVVRLADDVFVDLDQFERLAGNGDLEQATAALAMYRGELFSGMASLAQVEARRDLVRALFVETALRVAQQLAIDDRRGSAELLRRLLAADRTNEQAHRLLIRNLAESGRHAEALRQFEECRAALDAVGLAPSPQTWQLHEAIVRGEIAPPSPRTTGWTRVARRLLGSASPPAMRGRSDISSLLEEFTSGNSGVLLLVGEAGIGKTHAAVEGARLAAQRDALLMCGAALEYEHGVPYAPFIDAWNDHLRAEGRGPDENPLLSFASLAGGNPQEDKLRLFQNLQRSLDTIAAGRVIYFILDDLHFADESTLHLFHYLARAARTMSLLLVGTCREEELKLNAPLHALVSTIYRERLGKRNLLNRLDREATRQVIDDRLGEPVAEEALQSIYRLTEGNPFFTEEVVQTLREKKTLAVPHDLTSVIIDRVRRLGPEVDRLLKAAAVLGQSFEFDLARRVAGCGEDAIGALETSLGARLIEEDDERYRFRHGLVRESLYQQISRVRRIELHRAVADIIEEVDRERVEDLAFHLRAAGDLRRALPYFIEAGRRAAIRLGLDEAVNFYEQALVAMDELKLPPDEERFMVLLRLGQISFSLSNLGPAVRQFDDAAALSRDGWQPSRTDRAKAIRCAALALITSGNLVEANDRLQSAMNVLAGEEESSEYPHVLYLLAQLRWHEGRHSEAYAVAERCLHEAERQGDPQVIAKGYEILSLSCHSLGQWKNGIEFEERRRALVGSTVDVAQAFDVHL